MPIEDYVLSSQTECTDLTDRQTVGHWYYSISQDLHKCFSISRVIQTLFSAYGAVKIYVVSWYNRKSFSNLLFPNTLKNSTPVNVLRFENWHKSNFD